MVVTNTGLNKTASSFTALITTGQWGEGTTDPSVSDTGLTTALSSTLTTVSATTSGNSSQFVHTLSATTANGEALTEYELRFSDGTNFNHTLGGTFNKSSSNILTTISTIGFNRQ